MDSLSSALWHRAQRIISWGDKHYEDADSETPRFENLRRVCVGSVQFLAIPAPKTFPTSGAIPKTFTVIDIGDRIWVSKDLILQQLDVFKTCDTFQPDFLHGVLFTSSDSSGAAFAADADAALRDAGVEWTKIVSDKDYPKPLRPGPYLRAEGSVFELWRLHDDPQECFVSTVIQTGTDNHFRTVPCAGDHAHTRAVVVPSRLHTHASRNKHLSGLRVVVKDNFHLAGVKTSLCNRAYHDLYPPPAHTAACIQKLLDAGAVVLGKTKLSSFAATEEPIECVDYPAPWNPRADGYQSPAGSSSGSGVAVAAYEWVDIGIGSDTSGSGRRPAHWNGCIAMRPSHGTLPMDGFVPSFQQFDVQTFFGRDLRKCRDFAEAWYGESLPKTQADLPTSIVVPTDYLTNIENQAQLALIEEFISDLEAFFKIERRAISLESCWAETAGNGALAEYMKDACRHSFWYDDYHSMDAFRKDHEEKFGRTPYVSPPVRWQWDIASHISEEDREEAVTRLEVYRAWFASEIMKVGELNTIVVIPVEEIAPRYRDEPPSRKFYPTGVPMLFLSPILRAPELTIPIGEIPYESKVTGRQESLPVGISVMAPPGCDRLLVDSIIKFLEHARRPLSVQCGRSVFPK